jgi:hypothetical protein
MASNIIQFPSLPEHIERLEAIREGEEELAAWRRHRERQRAPLLYDRSTKTFRPMPRRPRD